MTNKKLTLTGRTKRVVHAVERAVISVVAILSLAGVGIPDNTTEVLVIALGNLVFFAVTLGTWGKVSAGDPDYVAEAGPDNASP